tara:strand:+ start:17796 stop:18722 length:927 start_codon:yes stop_codon:yes gene_type:complete
MSNNLQKTVREPIEFSGVGLHNGKNVNICLKPAEVNTGIIFKRTDVDSDKSIVEANFKNVNEPILCTKIKNSHGISVSTIEHLMAAFYGEGLDNVIVEVDAPEIPIMDGSSFDFVTGIRSYGLQEQNAYKKFIKVLKKIEVKDGKKYISIEPFENDLVIDFEIVYKNPLIRTRRKKFKLSSGNLDAIYNSKTFCLYEDIDQIKNQGLAQGGSLENAIVVKDNKILNEDGLRYRDEFVNHKILDCLGDLMLSGYRIFGNIQTSQGGHQLTNVLLNKFFSDQSNWKFDTYQQKEQGNQGSGYAKPIAVNG